VPLSAVDIIAIEQLYAAYNFAVDQGDGKGFAECLTPDGVFDMGTTRLEGSDALTEFAKGVPSTLPGARHIATNVLIEGDRDLATGRAYLMLVATGTSPISIIMTGQYEDHLVRFSDGGRFAERHFTADTPIERIQRPTTPENRQPDKNRPRPPVPVDPGRARPPIGPVSSVVGYMAPRN
jgi:hypothetical protein